MNQFIKLYLVYPIFLIAASIFFLFSIEYIDNEKTKEVTVDTYDACSGATDFKSCVLDKHEPLSRFVNCVGDLGKEDKETSEYFLRKYDQRTLSGCYKGYTFWEDSLVHYEKAAELISQPNLFKAFINNPGKLCNADIKNKKEGTLTGPATLGDLTGTSGKRISIGDGFNKCDESGNPAADSVDFTFSHSEDRFLWGELLLFLLFFIPSSLILIFFWRNKKVINKLLKDQQTYSWLSNKKKFRTALVLSLGWLAFFFIVLFSNGDFAGFNPFNERQSFELWLVYLFSLYPLMTLLISYFIYSAEEN